MRQAARTDSNQKEVVAALRQAGFRVDLTHRLGNGFPDVVVTGYNHNTGNIDALLVEIKTEKGKLTKDEKEYFEDYPEGGPLIIARSAEDVMRWFGAVE